MVLNFIFPHKSTAIFLLFPFTIQKKGKQHWSHFPFQVIFFISSKIGFHHLLPGLSKYVS